MHTTIPVRPLRALLPLGAILILATGATAQAVGVRAGIQQNSIDFEVLPPGLAAGSAASWHAGAYVELPVTAWLSVVPEARYMNRGWTLQGANTDADATASFLGLPVLAKIGSGAPRPISPTPSWGPWCRSAWRAT